MITLKDIAAKSGVSVRTVSVVLNDQPHRISPGTAKKIRDLALHLNYRPNVIARATRTKKTNQIGVLFAELANPHTGAVIEEIEKNLSRHGYKLLLGLTGWNPEIAKNYLIEFSHGMVDGIINFDPNVDEAEMKAFNITIPYIHFLRPSPRFNLTIDLQAGAEFALRHLWDLGHRRIGFISDANRRSGVDERLKGYHHFFQSRQIPLQDLPITYGYSTAASGQDNAPALLQKGCTAIFAANDQMALGAMKAVQDTGLDVPSDISIIGFDNSKSAEISNPALTTVALPIEDASAQSVAALVEIIQGPFHGKPSVLLPRLVLRQSTGPVKQR